MDLFTLESLDKLHAYLSDNPTDTRLLTDFTMLSEELGIQYVPVDYKIDVDSLDIDVPEDNNDDKLTSDRGNLKSVFEAFSGLTPAQATDERLWATLSVRHYSEYTSARWPLPKEEKKISGHLRTHWLCKSGVRSRVRDNSISRLWWMGYLVYQLDGWHPDEVANILFNNSDYRANIVERHSSASSYNVIGAILSITDEAFKEGIAFKRENFRSFMRQVNFLAGRTNMAALNQEQLIVALRPIYRECYANKKKGFLGLFGSKES